MSAATKLAAVADIRPPEFELLSPEQLCERVPGLTPRKLASQRQKPGGPPYYPATAQTIVYDWAEYAAWMRTQQRTQTDRYGERP